MTPEERKAARRAKLGQPVPATVRHGTSYSYGTYGCRCELCRAYAATQDRRGATARDRARHWGSPVPGHLPHGPGTRAAGIYGCPCKMCLPSGRRHDGSGNTPQRERNRKLRQRKKGQPVPPGTKHGRYAYRTYQCRCQVCFEAERAARGRRTESWRQGATGSWHEGDPFTVVHWPPVGTGNWTCPDCGQTFRRRRPPPRKRAAA